ncbi:glycoside hydrolase family 9 protein [Solwaraspora sp. WMMD1047]|uniref:glycoside hydrolase family 9 protein n=1 Tax=Solwaraspora sp. WMMD1047 TaxID=3016102 RepID=UPI002416850A|nr:glycoside hydrolase family 9 protein [Solwaraspora sp. WMMD1047]MDG4831102.1 glycoside hydrolase family 9 protein [Solwaraspora sp. WMMD1047]
MSEVPNRPRVRVNQVGYLSDAPKFATWVTDKPGGVPFTVRDRDGTVALLGTSTPWPVRPEPTSGQSLHLLDLTALTVVADGYRVEVGPDRSHPFRVGPDLYDGLSRDAVGLFYLLRSGTPILPERAPGQDRPAGHVGVPPNTGDTAVPGWTGPEATRLYPDWRPTGTFDVSGGWYDAGDYGKYVVSGGIALWQLLHLLRLLRSNRDRVGAGAGSGVVPESVVAEECRWQLDWLLRMQVPPGHQYAGLAFHRVHGTQWSPMPGRAHEDPTTRVLHRPSTAAALHLAAVAAQGARLFAADDRGYADRLLTAARAAYRAAQAYPDLAAPDDEGRYGGGPYDDARLADEFYWAAVGLWLATGEEGYRADLTASGEHTADVFDPGGFDFNAVSAPARLDLATGDRRLPDHDRVVGSVLDAAERLLDLQRGQPWGQPYAPAEGWAWGSNGRILNNLVVLATAHELSGDRRWRDAVAGGMDYLLGRNALGQCYVTGYGTDASAHLRTRQFGHDLDPTLPAPPAGALAGGANSTHTAGFPTDPRLDGLPPQLRYLDVPTSETTNDICIRWNAPLAYIASYLSLSGRPG